MRAINVHDAKTHFSALLSAIERGQSFRICRNGTPVADLVPHRGAARTQPDEQLRRLRIDYDPTEDLSGDEWGEVE